MCERCLDLELEIIGLRAERDMLLRQRESTKEWLGKLIHGSPIDPMNGSPDPNRVLADRLVEEYPEKKIQAIKELRTRSANGNGECLGLKQAKDYIDAAYARAEQRKKDYQDNLPF